MALFKFRKGDDDRVANATQPESAEVMRRRARHRLIGAAVLVLVAVIGFPLLFDTQPRPIAVDLPIDIPDRNKTKPLAIPAPPPAAVVAAAAPSVAPVTAAAPAPEPKVTTAASLDAKEQVVTAKAESKPVVKPELKPEPRADPKSEPKPEARIDDGAKAKALLEGKSVEAATPAAVAVEGRFVVQIGAFADPAKAQEARHRVERTGLKTYTQVAETKDGKRIRVRVGPYANRAEAEKAASKIKGLDLPAAILTL
ncbi:MAG: SPOR domain-containing protein [Burkholderiaceae bacterium]|nr:SPOR domain-containing protein [Burkholderiaceae bacterium]